VDSMVVHHNDWTSQIKDVIIPNINLIWQSNLIKLLIHLYRPW
jgi:hypothetical protein